MTDTKKLQGKMKEKGYTIAHLARHIEMSAGGLFNKIHNDNEFVCSEVSAISDVLGLSADERQAIFFANEVELNSTNNTKNGN